MLVLSGGANYVIIQFAPPLLFCNKEENKHTITYTKGDAIIDMAIDIKDRQELCYPLLTQAIHDTYKQYDVSYSITNDDMYTKLIAAPIIYSYDNTFKHFEPFTKSTDTISKFIDNDVDMVMKELSISEDTYNHYFEHCATKSNEYQQYLHMINTTKKLFIEAFIDQIVKVDMIQILKDRVDYAIRLNRLPKEILTSNKYYKILLFSDNKDFKFEICKKFDLFDYISDSIFSSRYTLNDIIRDTCKLFIKIGAFHYSPNVYIWYSRWIEYIFAHIRTSMLLVLDEHTLVSLNKIKCYYHGIQPKGNTVYRFKDIYMSKGVFRDVDQLSLAQTALFNLNGLSKVVVDLCYKNNRSLNEVVDMIWNVCDDYDDRINITLYGLYVPLFTNSDDVTEENAIDKFVEIEQSLSKDRISISTDPIKIVAQMSYYYDTDISYASIEFNPTTLDVKIDGIIDVHHTQE